MLRSTVRVSERIEKFILQYDSEGYVMPPETFNSPGAKNWIARITGRSPKYRWNRKWLGKAAVSGRNPKYNVSSFEENEIYEIHASFFSETESLKNVPAKNRWQVEKIRRTNSLYNGFWKVVGVNDDGIRMSRMYTGDMNVHFPKNDPFDGKDRQTSLSEFTEKKKEKHII